MRRYLTPVLSALCLSCAFSSAFAQAPKIGVLLKGRSKFWSVVEQGATAAGQKLGAEVIVKAPPTETDTAVQIQLLNALAAQGVQAIVIAPSNKDALAQPAAALAAKGIKFIVIDSPLGGDAGVTFIGTDHHAAGEAAGKLLATLVGDGEELSIFRHAQNNAATGDRENGAIDKVKESHPAVIVHSDIFASAEKESEIIERANLLLAKYPKAKAILASGTPGTMALRQILSTREPGSIKFVGFGFNLNEDVAASIEAGTMHGWIAQQPSEIGRDAIETALAVLAGKTVPPVVHTDFVVVTKQNLHDPKVQALLKL